MPRFEKTQVIPCPASQMFDVVMDIESYPEFLPWVADARILKRETDVVQAELVAEFAGLHHTFRTVDHFIPHQQVKVGLLEGPFRFLDSVWKFVNIGEHSCRVDFSIAFEFRNMMLAIVATPVFSHVCQNMVQAFEQRATTLYQAQLSL